MKFSPLTEDEIKKMSLAPEGIYSYRVISAEEKTSKTGNEYLSLMLEIWGEGTRVYILFTGLFTAKLIKHFCDINGLQDQYNSGNLAATDCLGKGNGKILVDIQEGKPNERGGLWPAKNGVKDYIIDPVGSQTMPLGAVPFSASGALANEDIPF
jgi:hypothetical protein